MSDMNRPVTMSRIDFVRSRLNSLRMDMDSIMPISAHSHPGPIRDMFDAIHDALTELTDEVQSIRENVRFHRDNH